MRPQWCARFLMRLSTVNAAVSAVCSRAVSAVHAEALGSESPVGASVWIVAGSASLRILDHSFLAVNKAMRLDVCGDEVS